MAASVRRMIVLGVDPGTRVTGYGVVSTTGRGPRLLLECGAIRPIPKQPLERRLREIYEGIQGVIDRNRPDVVSVEGIFYGANARTTVALGQARGVVLLAAAVRGIPVAEYPPAEVKSAVVGSGRAHKEQVALMVQEHLGLATPPSPEDAADGTAVALCHLFRAALALDTSRDGGTGRGPAT